jgi:hypothetical protein
MARKPQIGGITIAVTLGLAVTVASIALVLTNIQIKDGFQDRTVKDVAIMFSGRIKGFQNVLPKLKKIKDKYNPVIFCSLNEVEMTQDIKLFCKELSIPEDQVNIEQTVIPDWAGKCNTMNPTLNVYSMYYHENKAFGMIERYVKNNHKMFDCVLYYRADMNSTDELKLLMPEKNTIYLPNDRGYGGYNDRMAYGDYESMKIYCNLITVFADLCNDGSGRSINAEKMLQKYLESKTDIKIASIPYNTNLHEQRNDKIKFGIVDP